MSELGLEVFTGEIGGLCTQAVECLQKRGDILLAYAEV